MRKHNYQQPLIDSRNCCETHCEEISRWANEGGAIATPQCNGSIHKDQPTTGKRSRAIDMRYLKQFVESHTPVATGIVSYRKGEGTSRKVPTTFRDSTSRASSARRSHAG